MYQLVAYTFSAVEASKYCSILNITSAVAFENDHMSSFASADCLKEVHPFPTVDSTKLEQA